MGWRQALEKVPGKELLPKEKVEQNSGRIGQEEMQAIGRKRKDRQRAIIGLVMESHRKESKEQAEFLILIRVIPFIELTFIFQVSGSAQEFNKASDVITSCIFPICKLIGIPYQRASDSLKIFSFVTNNNDSTVVHSQRFATQTSVCGNGTENERL